LKKSQRNIRLVNISNFLIIIVITGIITATFSDLFSFLSTVVNAVSDNEVSKDNNYRLKYTTFKKDDKKNSYNEQSNLKPATPDEDSNVYVVWEELVLRKNNTFALEDIFFAKSNDKGKTFSSINLSNNKGGSLWPQISSEGNNVYVVWGDDTNSNDIEVFFTVSNDAGKKFNTIKKISNNIGFTEHPKIFSEGNNVYLVWKEGLLQTEDIFFARSNDTGKTFSTPINLSNDTAVSRDPKVLSAENNVYVVWRDYTHNNTDLIYNIFFKASNDGGETFSSPISLHYNKWGIFSPQLATADNNVYVLWHENIGNSLSSILFTRSNDTGKTFSTPIILSNGIGNSSSPQITSKGDNVYVVWDGYTNNNRDIFFTVSNDTGKTFSTPITLSNNTIVSYSPQIMIEEKNVYIVWESQIDKMYKIFFTGSNNNGQTFSTPIHLNTETYYSTSPQLATADKDVYIIWFDYNSLPGPTDSEIFFTASNDTGHTFEKPMNLSNSTRFSTSPQNSSSIS